VTVGQIAPGTLTSCSVNFEWVQASTPDSSYAMPASGVITSWSHKSQGGAGQMATLKIYRKVGDPASYQVVGHDGPHPVDPNTVVTFTSSVPVKAGDVLGITGAGGAASIGCLQFMGTGERGTLMGNLADGGIGDFSLGTGRLNVSAVLNPTNSFTLGKVKLNKKKGTATIAASVPNPGVVTASGSGVKITTVTATGPGDLKVAIGAAGSKKRQLRKAGKVKLKAKLTYSPLGGDPSTQSRKLKLKQG
jgi:hypothetical protein